MKKIINYKLVTRRAFLLAYDMIAVCCSNFLALLLRYEFQLDDIPGYFIFSATMFKNTVYTINDIEKKFIIVTQDHQICRNSIINGEDGIMHVLCETVSSE